MEAKNFTVNISVNGEMDVDKIAQAIRRVIDKEIARVDPKPEPLKVGDYAKVVDRRGLLNVGDIVKISDRKPNYYEFFVNRLSDNKLEAFDSSELEKLSEEEIAQAKAEAERAAERKQVEAKWAKIGRKVDEFKVGDIVQVMTNNPGGADRKKGYIGEITEFRNNRSFCVGGRCGWMGYSGVSLITPVEARFDR